MPNEPTPPNQNPWSELDVPHGGEVSIEEVNTFYWKFVKSPTRPTPWDNSDVRDNLKKELGAGELLLRGPVQIVKGKEPTIGVTLDLGHALEILYGFDTTTTRGQDWFALVDQTDEKERGETVEAKLKIVYGVREKPNHIIISKGLADKLNLTENNEIGIREVLTHVDDLDLDRE